MHAHVLLVEDDASAALHLKRLLQSWGHEVPAVVASAVAAFDAVRKHRVDVALVDIELGGTPSGVAIAQELRARHGIPTIFATGHADETTLGRAKLVKPVGYLVKPFTENQLRAALELALYHVQGGPFAPEGRARDEPSYAAAEAPPPLPEPPGAGPHPALTKRETEILTWLARGAATVTLARALRISPSTARNHVRAILTKLRVHSRLEAVSVGLRSGLVRLNHAPPDRGPNGEPGSRGR